jgi:Ca2+-binding EF-hand superfamily protein
MESTFSLTATGSISNEPTPATNQEERELLRVFERLCNYEERTRKREELRVVEGNIKMLFAQQRTKDAEEMTVRSRELVEELKALDKIEDKKISVDDVHAILTTLKYKVTRKEVEEYVWEVDEDLDHCISWSEMKLMYNRNLKDRTGLEPNRIFNVTQFLIYDKNENNKVSVDETMNMLYARYGRTKMEVKLKELFGANMLETGREGGEITFKQFIEAVDKVQLETFWKTTKGRIISQTTAGKRSLETLVQTVSKQL